MVKLENKWIKKWCNGFSGNDGYPRYIGIDGMHSLPLKLSEKLNVFQKTTIKTLKLLKHDWLLEGADNINFSSKYLIMTPPLPHTNHQCPDRTVSTGFKKHVGSDETLEIS